MQIEEPPLDYQRAPTPAARRGLLIVHTGDGKGKSTAAFGLALRAHGRGLAVQVWQFMKVPSARFGELELQGQRVTGFSEKPQVVDSYINGGFFVLSPSVLDLIDGDQSVFEGPVLARLIENGQLSAFQHTGFWRPMDTLRDKLVLEDLWNRGAAPWKRW